MLSSSLHFALLFCILQVCYSQFEGFGGGGPKICPTYSKCKKDEEPVPKWPMKLTSTGCDKLGSGKLGGGMSISSFGKFNDSLHSGCCDNWNACIQICGTFRAQCDAIFDKCMESTCDKITNEEEERKMCMSNAGTKKLLLQLSDCTSYSEAQEAGCECVKKTEVQEKRKGFLTKFYKKHNPTDVNKVDNLASKATDVKKFASLLLKLVVKYPKSVKRIKDPQEQMIEEMMRKQREPESKPSKKETETTETIVDSSDKDGEEEERIEL